MVAMKRVYLDVPVNIHVKLKKAAEERGIYIKELLLLGVYSALKDSFKLNKELINETQSKK